MATPARFPDAYQPDGGGANLADILERVLDKGIVIAGDIRINLLDIELLTIKLRLIVASIDKAKEMGIDWWEDDPALSSGARRRELSRENDELKARIAALEASSRTAESAPEIAATEARPRKRGGSPRAKGSEGSTPGEGGDR
ncbi:MULTISPECIES: gas vesicle protein [unclassified Streptomyces]|uniref:gas vesicle protein n=1 Tax=unclassified Streptomyces TaxID=2593676 RepID=UPI001DC21823|nr:gas vesicle protein [Streptomyces sp. MAG02]